MIIVHPCLHLQLAVVHVLYNCFHRLLCTVDRRVRWRVWSRHPRAYCTARCRRSNIVTNCTRSSERWAGTLLVLCELHRTDRTAIDCVIQRWCLWRWWCWWQWCHGCKCWWLCCHCSCNRLKCTLHGLCCRQLMEWSPHWWLDSRWLQEALACLWDKCRRQVGCQPWRIGTGCLHRRCIHLQNLNASQQ